ncbi:caspase family protein [Streptomyces sp. WAC04114]|uniref:caspase family protein n=1 Tax=Streptomyces sp. WAC04114 TaxID=2867961 RepID=UPI001C8C1C6E|nr:caspase family protein [Streptomyces sp. WAC04114]MBX9365572.1 caspase family protein [Streptomyces sp. WAC04114]
MAPYVTHNFVVQGGPLAGPMSLPEGTQQNARTLAAALTDPDLAGLSPETCHVVSSLHEDDFLQRFTREVPAGDGLIVYWTGGRCRADRSGRLQLALPVANQTRDDWLDVQDLVAAMKGVDSPDRLLVLDTCLTVNSILSNRQWVEEISRLSKQGVAVLTSVGRSPYAFAANNTGPSVLTQHLIKLLSEVADRRDPLDLKAAYRRLRAATRREGYRPPILCNPEGFARPLVPVRDASPMTSAHRRWLPALRAASTAAMGSCARYALAVAGAPLTSSFFDPVGDAHTLSRALVDTHCGFTRDTTSVLDQPPTRQGLLEAVSRVAATADNMALIYLVGHGTVRHSGRDLDLVLHLQDEETVRVSELVAWLRRSRAQSTVLMLDVCRVRQDERVPPLTREFLADRRPGISRLLVEWNNLAARTVEASDEQASRWAADNSPWQLRGPASSAPAEREVRWTFDFADARITLLDEAGPLEHWASRLLSRPSAVDPLVHADELLSTVADSATSGPEQPAAMADDCAVLAPASSPKPDSRQPSRGHRRHHPRLRVAEGALPLHVGQRLDVTFNYQPQEPGRAPQADDATDNNPLDLTLHIAADTADVAPALIHTRLTDEAGTPPEHFQITPSSPDPVTLRIDVLRRADGAVIQSIERVLTVAGRDGSTT